MPDNKKTERILYLFERFMMEDLVRKSDIATLFKTSERSIQRDIEELKNYCVDQLVNDRSTQIPFSLYCPYNTNIIFLFGLV